MINAFTAEDAKNAKEKLNTIVEHAYDYTTLIGPTIYEPYSLIFKRKP